MKSNTNAAGNRIETALRAAGFAWWEMELPSGIVFFDDTKTRMLDRDAKDFVHYSHFTELLHADDHSPTMQAMQDHLDGKTPYYEAIYRIKAKDGAYLTFYDKGKIVSTSADGDIRLSGIVINISGSILDR